MARLILYTNNQYHCITTENSILLNLGDTIPVLNTIFPQHIVHLNDQYHFILDICNNLHVIDFTETINLYDNIYHTSNTNIIMVYGAVNESKCKIVLCTFDEPTNTFAIVTTQIKHFDDPVQRRQRTSSTKYIHGIKNYSYGTYYPIVLIGLNDDMYACHYNHSSDIIYSPTDKTSINECITDKQNNLLYSAINDKLCGSSKVISLLYNNLYNTMTAVQSNTCSDDEQIIEYDTSNYITTAHIGGFTFLISSDEIVVINGWNDDISKVSFGNNTIGTDFITHGITRQFNWSPLSHHYLPQHNKDIISTIMMCNKHTKYHKLCKPVLFIIIRLLLY